MTIWVDAQLSPFIALFINQTFPEINAVSVRSLELLTATDHAIFMAARNAQATILSKDADFVKMIALFDVPPQLIWVTCGNTSNRRLCEILQNNLLQAVQLLLDGEKIVEISA